MDPRENLENTIKDIQKDTLTFRVLEYATQPTSLIEEWEDEVSKIPELLKDPPKIFLVHTYNPPIELNKGLKAVKPKEGHYVCRAVVDLVKKVVENGRDAPTILIAGGYPEWHGGKCNDTLYKHYLTELFKKQNLNVRIVTETEERESKRIDSTTTDTRSELFFLKKWKETNDKNDLPALTIGRLPHIERIRKLIKNNKLNAETISVESILTVSHYTEIHRLAKKFLGFTNREFEKDLSNFRKFELIKLLIMLVDTKGEILEELSKITYVGKST